jgi:hypothetical protein
MGIDLLVNILLDKTIPAKKERKRMLPREDGANKEEKAANS